MNSSLSQQSVIAAATPESISQAADYLRQGKLVAFATETVYGLGADATNDKAVAAIFAAKNRPDFNPLIAHVADMDAAAQLVTMDQRSQTLAAKFWPGPLTLVLPRRKESPVSLLASAGLDSIAVRVPAHPVALALLRGVSPTTAAHVAQGLGDKLAMILDGGACAVGVESTVLDLTTATPTLLRPGGVTLEQLKALLGPVAVTQGHDDSGPKSPGMLASHYAPGLPVRLEAETIREGEALLGFGPVTGAELSLSPTGDLAEAAANLFAMLRALDRAPFTGIAVSPIPAHGLGLAINDRLRRAAAPRI